METIKIGHTHLFKINFSILALLKTREYLIEKKIILFISMFTIIPYVIKNRKMSGLRRRVLKMERDDYFFTYG